MVALNQCLEIINLTSLDLGNSDRYAIVGHSCRVAAKAKSFDEVIVGLMHALYATSSYTRALYRCDVEGVKAWAEALDLFVWRQDKLPEIMSEDRVRAWRLEKTKWSSTFRQRLIRMSKNQITRNVMIHSLEDRLDILSEPERYEDLGPHRFVLPWERCSPAEIRRGKWDEDNVYSKVTEEVPLLLLPLSEEERENLIEKYHRAIELLINADDGTQSKYTFMEVTRRRYSQSMLDWFDEWREWQEELKLYDDKEYEEIGEGSLLCDDGPSGATDLVQG